MRTRMRSGLIQSRWSPACSSSRSAGFSLAEVIVALVLTSIVILSVGSGFVFVTRGWSDQQGKLAAQQNLRAAVQTLSREVRLAAACMLPSSVASPVNFQPANGVYSGTNQDTLIVRSNTSCAIGTLTSAGGACNACTTVYLDSVANFAAGTWAYIYQPPYTGQPAFGQYFLVQQVNGPLGTPANTLVVDQTVSLKITLNYTAGGAIPASSPPATYPFASVYGIQERTFTIGTFGGTPTLMLQTINNSATPFLKGVESLNLTYILNRVYDNIANCPAGSTGGSPNLCIVNLPASSGEWVLVRGVTVTVGVRSTQRVRGAGSDGYLHLTEVFQIAPRNFVFQTSRL